VKQWYVVHTLPRKENVALQNLRSQSFDVFFPRYICLRKHARRAETVLSPLFPRYLFVALDVAHERWSSINSTRGVAYLVQQNGCPVSVPLRVITELKRRSDLNEVVPLSSLEIFEKGTKLEVIDGTFVGQAGIYDRMEDTRRVQILLSLLGKEVKVVLPLYSVAAI
jgi:transcriptional antiterminator RfaH